MPSGLAPFIGARLMSRGRIGRSALVHISNVRFNPYLSPTLSLKPTPFSQGHLSVTACTPRNRGSHEVFRSRLFGDTPRPRLPRFDPSIPHPPTHPPTTPFQFVPIVENAEIPFLGTYELESLWYWNFSFILWRDEILKICIHVYIHIIYTCMYSISMFFRSYSISAAYI